MFQIQRQELFLDMLWGQPFLCTIILFLFFKILQVEDFLKNDNKKLISFDMSHDSYTNILNLLTFELRKAQKFFNSKNFD